MRRTIMAVFLIVTTAGLAAAQETASPRKLFEAGHHEQVVEAVAAQGESAPPEETYLAAQSLTRLERRDQARDLYRRLEGDEENPWTFIGRSAAAALDGDMNTAAEAANRAVALSPDHVSAQYQLGLVSTLRDDFHGASAAFEKTTELDPNHAYAHYYAGIAFNKLRRLDEMSRHFSAFIALAPDAPEAHQVAAILKTLRR